MTNLHSRLEELYSESSGLALAKVSLATILSSRSLATNTQSTGISLDYFFGSGIRSLRDGALACQKSAYLKYWTGVFCSLC